MDPRTTKRKSSLSFSNGNCVEAEVLSRKAPRKAACSTNNGNCVETSVTGENAPEHMIALTDSKLGENSPVLTYTPDEWRAFITGVKNGEFDLDEDGYLPPVPVEA